MVIAEQSQAAAGGLSLRPEPPAAPLARGLGWMSIGLGVAQVARPGTVSRLLGLPEGRGTIAQRVLGVREIATGAGILTRPRPTRWLRGRAAGDVMDLALLGTAFASDRARRRRLVATAGAVAGIAVLDVMAARRMARQPEAEGDQHIEAVRSITIRKSPEEVYGSWRNLERLPRFMAHLESVQVIDRTRSRWRVSVPAGAVEWTAEIVEDRPGEVIAWRSLPGSDIGHRGRVSFKRAPRDQGTEMTARVEYDAPGGTVGAVVARLLGFEPGQQIGDNLRRLKQILETGDVVRSEASPWGVDRVRQRMQQAGQPPAPDEIPPDPRAGTYRGADPGPHPRAGLGGQYPAVDGARRGVGRS